MDPGGATPVMVVMRLAPGDEIISTNPLLNSSHKRIGTKYDVLTFVTGGLMGGLAGVLFSVEDSRGAAVSEHGIVVTTGSQQGIDLIARLLIDPGDVVVVERPAYLAALQTFALAQASLRTIESDASGARVEDLDALLDAIDAAGKRVKLVYVVANFANPSGATLSRERRLRLLRTAVARVCPHRWAVTRAFSYRAVWSGR